MGRKAKESPQERATLLTTVIGQRVTALTHTQKAEIEGVLLNHFTVFARKRPAKVKPDGVLRATIAENLCP